MEYYSVLKRKKILTYATTWMKLEDMIRHDKSVTREQIFKKYFDAILFIKKIFGHTTQHVGSQFPN